MAQYENRTFGAPLSRIDFATQGTQTLAFIRPNDTHNILPLLAAAGLEHVISDTTASNERLMVAVAKHSPADTLTLLNEKGAGLAPPAPSRSFNPWLWRGITSIIGQGGQLFSSFLNPDKASVDRNAVLTFASFNMAANITNMVFGSQRKDDPHQLRALKSDINALILKTTPETTGKLPSVDDNRRKQHRSEDVKRSTSEQAYDVAQKISITGGEIGLRTIGSAGLAFPMKRWKDAFHTFADTRSLTKTFHVAKNPTRSTFITGLVMLTGKFTSFLSKEADPFNPTPPSTVDTIREKMTFPASSLIEGGAAVYMMQDRFVNHKVKIGNKVMPDHFGGFGNASFIGGYAIRYNAPYGTREVNMRELYSHTADALCHVPQDRIPALLAEIATKLETHFKAHAAKPTSLDTIYSEIAGRLKSYYNIDIAAPISAAPQQKSLATAKEALPETPDTHINSASESAVIAAPTTQLERS